MTKKERSLSQKQVLNKNQLEAIKHKQGPLLIIAGAGTGKTTVITERIKHLIISKMAKPTEILALTFTEKASREMEERVDVAMPYGYSQMWISTFHSFCDRVLRDELLHIGLNPSYKLMTQAETVQLVRNHLFEFDLDYFRPLGNPGKFIEGMLQHFSRLQDEDISPKEYTKWVQKQKIKKIKSGEERIEIKKWSELADAYKKYDQIKAKDGYTDFGDLIVKTLKLFRERPNILASYKKRFKYILVDEYQDTNYAQNELVKLLVGRSGNVSVVADDDQSIYRFRGAAFSNIIQFKNNFPKTKIVVLTKNYRSTQEILNRAYKLIQYNNPDRLEAKEKIDKKLISQIDKDGGKVEYIHADRVENEADWVVEKIQAMSSTDKKDRYNFSDFAILVRANSHSEPFLRALARRGIPYQFLGPGRLFKQEEVVDLIAFLKVIYDINDSVSLYRLLQMDYFDISSRDLAAIGSFAKKHNISLFMACERALEIYIGTTTKKKIDFLLKQINRTLKNIKKNSAGQILYDFLEATGLIKALFDPNDPEAEKRAANISKFFDKIKSYETDHAGAGVFDVVDWLELSAELGESPLASDSDWTDVNKVNILTIHSSKGLEFPVVFIVNLVNQRFPSIERKEKIPIPEPLIKEIVPQGDFHLQEERRLFYVATTRAMENLYLTSANYYGEGKREKKPSPFVFEAMGDKVDALEYPQNNLQQLSFLDFANEDKEIPINKEKASKPSIDYLSYSQIETFKTCPLHYKLKYLLRIPTPASPAQSFGTSMHSALKNFYQIILNGKKPTKDLLLNLLTENWLIEGYLDKSHENKFMKKGKDYLSDYFDNEFNRKVETLSLETPFVVPLPKAKLEIRPLKIGGKIDRVDRIGEGKIQITDYKTGANIPTQKQVEHDLQLTFYALAANLMKEDPFDKNPGEILLTLYYFDGAKKISTTRTRADLTKAIKEIYKYRERIENSDFSCSHSILCRNCEYKLFCNSES